MPYWTKHAWGTTIVMGFVFLRPTPATLGWFGLGRAFFHTDRDDQSAFNRALSECGKARWKVGLVPGSRLLLARGLDRVQSTTAWKHDVVGVVRSRVGVVTAADGQAQADVSWPANGLAVTILAQEAALRSCGNWSGAHVPPGLRDTLLVVHCRVSL